MPSIIFIANVSCATTLGWKSFKRFGNAFISAFPDVSHIFEYVVVDGEKVVTIGTYQGTHKGEMQNISQTNAKLKLPVMYLDRMVNVKNAEHRVLAKEIALMQQLGVFLAPK